MANKVKIKNSTDAEILEECKNEINCGDCKITWTTPPRCTQINPPANTVAIVVDVVKKQGATRIFEIGGRKRVDAVGTESAGNMVIVPWDSN